MNAKTGIWHTFLHPPEHRLAMVARELEGGQMAQCTEMISLVANNLV